MDDISLLNTADEIQSEIDRLETAKSRIDTTISELRSKLHKIKKLEQPNGAAFPPILPPTLSPDSIHRYSRHLILPSFGVQGQTKLLNSSILVIGAGGLGSPALLYLAASGVGRLGIVDHDAVELSNMHRQIIHTEEFIGKPKVSSAAATCRAINSNLRITEHQELLKNTNALQIIAQYDVVVDASDNAPTRYMISDACVILNKPLVSGAALGLEGQLTVYNFNNGPCYRCLFPTPPPASACQRCSDGGVLGVVPGIIGCLQALEAIKIASDTGETMSERMLIFDASSTRVRVVKIRGRSRDCEVCGENSSFTKGVFWDFDYYKFASVGGNKVEVLESGERISGEELCRKAAAGEEYVLVDVRPKHHFEIVSLPDSLNVPMGSLETRMSEIEAAATGRSLYVICRRGNDSQLAVKLLRKYGYLEAKDVIGGLEGWSRDVDPTFPIY